MHKKLIPKVNKNTNPQLINCYINSLNQNISILSKLTLKSYLYMKVFSVLY